MSAKEFSLEIVYQCVAAFNNLNISLLWQLYQKVALVE